MNSQHAESFIAPPFLADFRKIAEEIIKGEEIIWAGNVCQFKDSSGIDRYPFGYLVVTKGKIIKVLFNAEHEGGGFGDLIGIFLAPLIVPVIFVVGIFAMLFTGDKDEKPTFEKVRVNDPNKKRQEISVLNSNHKSHSHGSHLKVAPATPLTNNETASRTERVFSLDNLTNIDRFESQDDHTGERIVEFDIRFVPDETMQVVFYKEQDAKTVYDILLSHLEGKSRSLQEVSAISEQLKKLGELHKEQVINDAEFEAAKKRLLEK